MRNARRSRCCRRAGRRRGLCAHLPYPHGIACCGPICSVTSRASAPPLVRPTAAHECELLPPAPRQRESWSSCSCGAAQAAANRKGACRRPNSCGVNHAQSCTAAQLSSVVGIRSWQLVCWTWCEVAVRAGTQLSTASWGAADAGGTRFVYSDACLLSPNAGCCKA